MDGECNEVMQRAGDTFATSFQEKKKTSPNNIEEIIKTSRIFDPYEQVYRKIN